MERNIDTNVVEMGRLIDELLCKRLPIGCRIEIYHTNRLTLIPPDRVNVASPVNYMDGSALGARIIPAKN